MQSLYASKGDSYIDYKNASLGISFQYPEDWYKEETQLKDYSIIEIIPPNTNSTEDNYYPTTSIGIHIEDLNKNITIDNYIINFSTTLNDFFGPSSIEHNSTTLGGMHGYKTIVEGNDNDTNMRTMLVSTIRGSMLYQVIYSAESQDYLNYLPIANEVVKTFTLDGHAAVNSQVDVRSNISSIRTERYPTGSPSIFLDGDILLGTDFGQLQWYHPNGSLIEVIYNNSESALSPITGMAFDTPGNLYATEVFADNVTKISSDGKNITKFGGGFNESMPESVAIDLAGNVFVGQADGNQDILKFDPNGNLIESYDVEVEDRGSDWIDLASDQCTIYYTSEGENVKRFNTCTKTQLSDFATDLPGDRALALKIIPNNLDQGGNASAILVADSESIVLLNSTGNITKTYDAPDKDDWFGLNIDPDGKSLWGAGSDTDEVYKFDIASGKEILRFNGTDTDEGLEGLGGIVIKGEVTAGRNNPPRADAGRDQIVNKNTTVVLKGDGFDSESVVYEINNITDTNKDQLIYLWRQTAGSPVAISLINENKSIGIFTAPEVQNDTMLTFELAVTDNMGANNTDSVNVIVKNNISDTIESNQLKTTTEDNFLRYENVSIGVRILYPSTWNVVNEETGPRTSFKLLNKSSIISENRGGNVSFISSAEDTNDRILENLIIQAQDLEGSPYLSNQSAYLESQIDITKQGLVNYLLLESDKYYKLINNNYSLPTYKTVYSYTDTQTNNEYKVLQISTIKDNKAYVLAFTAESSKYDSYLPVVQKMIDSFQILQVNQTSKNVIIPGRILIPGTDVTDPEDQLAYKNDTDMPNITNGNDTYIATQSMKGGVSEEPLVEYESDIADMMMKYPSKWNLTEDYLNGNILISFVSPLETSADPHFESVRVMVEPVTPGLVSIEEYGSFIPFVNDSAAEFNIIQSNLTTIQYLDNSTLLPDNKEQNSTSTNPAYKIVYSYTDAQTNDDYKVLQISTIIDRRAYVLAFTAEASKYDSYLPVVQKMIDSFMIRNAQSVNNN